MHNWPTEQWYIFLLEIIKMFFKYFVKWLALSSKNIFASQNMFLLLMQINDGFHKTTLFASNFVKTSFDSTQLKRVIFKRIFFLKVFLVKLKYERQYCYYSITPHYDFFWIECNIPDHFPVVYDCILFLHLRIYFVYLPYQNEKILSAVMIFSIHFT